MHSVRDLSISGYSCNIIIDGTLTFTVGNNKFSNAPVVFWRHLWRRRYFIKASKRAIEPRSNAVPESNIHIWIKVDFDANGKQIS